MSPAGHCQADSTSRGSQWKSVSGRTFADSPSYSRAMWGGHALEQLQGRGCHRAVSPTPTTIPSASPPQAVWVPSPPAPGCSWAVRAGQLLHLTATALFGRPDCCPPAAPPGGKRKSSENADGRACYGNLAPDYRKPLRPQTHRGRGTPRRGVASVMEHSLCGGREPMWGCVCSLATAGVGPRSSLAIAAPGASCSGCRVVLDTGTAAGPQAVVKRLSLWERGARSPGFSHAHTCRQSRPGCPRGPRSPQPGHCPSQGTHSIQSTGSRAGLHSSEHLITQSL